MQIKFNVKPSDAVRQAVRDAGFQWRQQEEVWVERPSTASMAGRPAPMPSACTTRWPTCSARKGHLPGALVRRGFPPANRRPAPHRLPPAQVMRPRKARPRPSVVVSGGCPLLRTHPDTTTDGDGDTQAGELRQGRRACGTIPVSHLPPAQSEAHPQTRQPRTHAQKHWPANAVAARFRSTDEDEAWTGIFPLHRIGRIAPCQAGRPARQLTGKPAGRLARLQPCLPSCQPARLLSCWLTARDDFMPSGQFAFLTDMQAGHRVVLLAIRLAYTTA